MRKAREAPAMLGLDLVKRVTPERALRVHRIGRLLVDETVASAVLAGADAARGGHRLRAQAQHPALPGRRGLPGHGRARDAPARRRSCRSSPDGVFLSNGPGDPAPVTYAIDTVKGLLGKKPIFGICLGHQLLALALGAKTYKLKFGHRGVNQPVLDKLTGKVEITTQNHGFAVDMALARGARHDDALAPERRTSEGLAVPSMNAFSVQYHPEAAAGPHDALYLFERFTQMIDRARA